MNCKKCGKKLNQDESFCGSCGTKNEIYLESNQQLLNINKKDKFLNTSTVSLIIFGVVIALNLIFMLIINNASEDPTGAQQAAGFMWIFLCLLPSIPATGVSSILAIVSIYKHFRDKKNNLNISKFRTISTILNIIQLIIVIATIIFLATSFWPKNDNYLYYEQANQELTLEYLNNTYSNQNDTFTLISCGYDMYSGSNERCYFKSEKYNDEITVYITRYDDKYRLEDNYFKLHMKEDAKNYFNNIVNQYAKAETKIRFSNLRLTNGEYLYFEDFIGSGDCHVDVYFISNSEVESDDINSILNNIANDKIYGSFNFITTNDTNLLTDYTLDEILNNQSELFVSKEDYDINYEFKIIKSN